MIHVQIASQVTAHGVSGVRWVLVESRGALPASEPDAAGATALAADPPPAPGHPTASTLQLSALKLLTIGLGLAAALWTAHVQLGPPGQPMGQPPSSGGPALPQAVPATQGGPALAAPPAQARPLQSPTAPDLAPPSPAASRSLPRLTAAL